MMKRLLVCLVACSLTVLSTLAWGEPSVSRDKYGTIIQDIGFEVVKGAVPWATAEIKFGDDEDVSTALNTVFGVGGNNSNLWLAAAATLNVTSSDADDTAAGAGARTILITYLDANYDLQSETVTMNGQTIVTTAAEMLRINRIQVVTAGTSGVNEGTIYIFTGTAASGVPSDLTKIVNGVTAEHNQTTSAFYTVPNGYDAFIYYGASCVGASTKTATVQFWGKPFGAEVFRIAMDFDILQNCASFPFYVPMRFPAKSDMTVKAKVDTGTARVSAHWQMILVSTSVL